MNENEVVDAMVAYLTHTGWEIVSKCHTHQRGVDIVARRAPHVLHVEAKGSRSTRRGKRFNEFLAAEERFMHVDVAFATASMNLERGHLSAVVLSRDPIHEKRMSQLLPALAKLGLGMYWVEADGQVTPALVPNPAVT